MSCDAPLAGDANYEGNVPGENVRERNDRGMSEDNIWVSMHEPYSSYTL